MLKKGLKRTIDPSKEVEVSIEGRIITVSGPKGKLSREFDLKGLRIKKEQNKVVVKSDTSRKKMRAAVGTTISHIKNMFKGVTEGFTSELKVVYSHFPINVSIQDDKVRIENFIGEEKPRYANIVGETEVEIKGEEIEVKGTNKEDVGQTAANIEQTAQVRGRDPRVFQDGIYIVKRP